MKAMERPLITIFCELLTDEPDTCSDAALDYFETVYNGGED
eukprot:CAMPEP_0176361314 /NCGR_PEP_ID=MMETSP0126-20121128/17658_1 /TAXON_ID=141414 ORGANISM="Strombidinopsis acuminatum, Strain SPMC142" /NCGR_SAMPLE_ID=MMETSP0126 /ASSEMBLY_ACC=CAM_ASM_000229 /LENGTH=40 /DNA_ID= /DNA_START= /DNA_END= /DNA_ORIENTATION=